MFVCHAAGCCLDSPASGCTFSVLAFTVSPPVSLSGADYLDPNVKWSCRRLSPGAGPRSGSGGEQSFHRRSSRCRRKPETQAGMRQGLVAAVLRSDLVDRSVRLVLIPAVFLFLLGAAVTKCCAVKEECGYKFTACEVPSRAEFIENILASFPVPNPTKRRKKKQKPCPCCSNIPHPLLWNQGIHFHPASSCFAG